MKCAVRRSALLGASLAVVGVVALGLGISFRHVLASLCFAVELGTLAVIGFGFLVDPYLAISAANRSDQPSGACFSPPAANAI